jgi:hypothetical protein
MTYSTAVAPKESAGRTEREHVADLLTRYPHISGSEAEEVALFLKTGRHLELGLLTSDDRVRRNLDSFMRENKAQFRVKWHEIAVAIALIVGSLAVLWLLAI